MISVGLSSVCCSSTTASSTKLSRSVPGNHYAVESRELIGDEIVIRDSIPHAEIFRIGSGMDGSNRDHEAQTIGGSHFPAAPMANQWNPILSRNQADISRRQ